jgi:hypothetical protein
VPVAGDLIAQAISSYIIWEAHELGVGKLTLMRMVGNTLVDTVIGSIPIAGDAFDVAFRANMKNLRLLQRHLEKQGYKPAGRGPIIEADCRVAWPGTAVSSFASSRAGRRTNGNGAPRLKRRGWRRTARCPG